MKDKKKSFRQSVEDFLTGRGFYIALSACVLVIGIAAWTLLRAGAIADRTDVADNNVTAGIVETGDKQDAAVKPKPEKIQKIEKELEDMNEEPEEPTAVIPEAPETEVVETIAPTEEPEENEMPLLFGWPVFGEVEVGYFADELVYSKTMLDWRTHSAIDIAAELGTKVMACARGTVSEIYEDALMGTVLVIDHGDGLESVYANLAATPSVNVGDTVEMSDVIGAVGDTAISETGQPYHLHFAMMKDGESVDPTEYMP